PSWVTSPVFFFTQKTAYEFFTWLEFRRVLFRSAEGEGKGTVVHGAERLDEAGAALQVVPPGALLLLGEPDVAFLDRLHRHVTTASVRSCCWDSPLGIRYGTRYVG